MPEILPFHKDITRYLRKHSIEAAFLKQIGYLKEDPRHPSLRVELLEPRHLRIYSFRITRRYRAIFIFRQDRNAAEILDVNDHYR